MLQVYAVFDKAVGAFAQPIFVRSRGEALRSFMQAVSADGSQMGRFAADYELHQLAEYDDQTGEFKNIGQRVLTALEASVSRETVVDT
nr:MAG: nonstructural protein [Microvirus sp.]